MIFRAAKFCVRGRSRRTTAPGKRCAKPRNQRSQSSFGAYYRRKRAHLGPEQATVATAHKMARVIYHLLKYREAYEPLSAQEYELGWQDRELAVLKKKAAKLGFALQQVT